MQSESEIDKEFVIQKIKSILPELKKLGIKKIGLFGSVKRREAKADSDVDILIEFVKGEKNYQNLLKIKDLLDSSINRKIDLVQVDGLSKYIGPKILEEVEYIEDHS